MILPSHWAGFSQDPILRDRDLMQRCLPVSEVWDDFRYKGMTVGKHTNI